MPDLYGMLQPLLAKMAPRPEEEEIGLPFQSTTGVNVGSTEKYENPVGTAPLAGASPVDSLPFLSTTGVNKGTTAKYGSGNVTAATTPRSVAPQAKGDTTSLMQALGSNPPDVNAMAATAMPQAGGYNPLSEVPAPYKYQGGMSGAGGDISAVPSAAPGKREIAPGVFGSSDMVEESPGVWRSPGGGARVGMPTGVPAGAGGMPQELPVGGGGNPFAALAKIPPNVAALGPAATSRGSGPPLAQAPQVDESDAGEAYRKQHYRQHVERFPDGTPVPTGTGKAEEHKGFWNRFKHALQGMGLGALQAMNTADPRDPNALMRALGGAIGGGATAGWNPQNADNLYNRVLVDPEADRQRQKQLVNMKIKMEQEEHSGKLLDQENLRKSRDAQIAHNQAALEEQRREQTFKEKYKPQEVQLERDKLTAQERQWGATAETARRNISHPPGHLYWDENNQPKIAPYTPQQLGENSKGLSGSQQWTQYVATVGTPKARVDEDLAKAPPQPNDIINFAVQNNMGGGTLPAAGQDMMELLQALREGTSEVTTPAGTGLAYGNGKVASQDRVKAAKAYFKEAEAFFRKQMENAYIAHDQQVRQQMLGGQGTAQPTTGAKGPPGTNAKTEGGLIAGTVDKLKR